MALLLQGTLDGNNAVQAKRFLDPTEDQDLVTLRYFLDNAGSFLNIVGNIDASGNPNYPAASEQEAYWISVGGRVGGASGKEVTPGNVIVAVNANAGGDEATVGTDWIVIQTQFGNATEEASGIIRIATDAEVSAGVLDNVAITPLKLAQLLESQPGAGFSVLFGDNSQTTFSFNHNMNKQYVVPIVVAQAANQQVIGFTIDYTDADNISLSFVSPPPSNGYRLVVT